MPGYIQQVLQKYKHPHPLFPQHSPYPAQPKKYGTAAQEALPPDKPPTLDTAGIKQVQQIVGSVLYYSRAVNITILAALYAIGADQAKATENTRQYTQQLLDYLATHPNATIRYYASNMILNTHSNAAYLVAPKAWSRAAGYFFLGWLLQNRQPIRLNGSIYTLCKLLKLVAGSAAEAKLGALFLYTQNVKIIRCTLEEMGHPQPPTPPLWQHNRCQHCQQHCQTTTITCHGDEVFLGGRSGWEKNHQCQPAPWGWMLSRLPKQGSSPQPSPEGTTLLSAWRYLS